MKNSLIYPLIILLSLIYTSSKSQSLQTVTPDTALQGQQFEVTIMGSNTDFLQGSTTLSFKQGSETMAPITGSLSIIDATQLSATISILSNATGDWTAWVDGFSLSNALHVGYVDITVDAPLNVVETDTFLVGIEMSQIPEDFDMISSDFDVSYNSSRLNFVEAVQAGSFSENGTIETTTPTAGTISVAFMNSSTITGNGTLVYLKFAALDQGTASISLSNCFLNETPNTHLSGTSITVEELVLPTATVSYSDTDGIVKEGDELTITASISKPLASTPPLKIEITGANTLTPTEMTRNSATNYTYVHTVGAGDGTASVSFSNAIDTEGVDVVSEPAGGGNFQVDNTPPTASISYSTTGPYELGENIQITATTSEDIAPGTPLKIELTGANSIAPTSMQRIYENLFRYDYQIFNGEGQVSVNLSNATDIAGNPIASDPPAGANFTIDALNYGDVSNNGTIQSYDAALALQYSISGLEPNIQTPWESWRITQADVDGDGNVLAYDASLILQYGVGSLDQFPVEGTKVLNDAPDAGVNIQVKDGYFVFYPYGELHSLNAEVITNENVRFTELQLDSFQTQNLFFSNEKNNELAFGLCLAEPYFLMDEILRVKYESNGQAKLTFRTIANTSTETFDFLTLNTNDNIDKEQIRVYPNPFSDEVFFTFDLEQSEKIIIKLYSSTGQLLKTLGNNKQIAPNGTLSWKPNLLFRNTQTILYEIVIGNRKVSGKLMRK